MPVTKTAKRALRSSAKKALTNSLMTRKLKGAIRRAKKIKSKESIFAAVSLADKAAKKKAIHKNKAARIKSSLSKLLPKTRSAKKSKKSPAKKK